MWPLELAGCSMFVLGLLMRFHFVSHVFIDVLVDSMNCIMICICFLVLFSDVLLFSCLLICNDVMLMIILLCCQ